MDTISVLKVLTAAAGVSGDEQEIADTAAELLRSFGEVTRDRIGNVVCRRKGNGRRVLLDAHMDQIGLVVLEITPEGFLRCAPCGGADKRVLTGAEVTVCGREKLFGVVTSTPPHLQKDGDAPTLPETILIDIGLSKERAEALVHLGDRVLLRPQFRILQNNCVSAPALDDRAGLCVLLEALEILQQNGCPDDITVVFSTREETTEGGAKSAAYNAKADLCIAVDVSFAHTPDAKPQDCGVLGKGVMIGYAPSLTHAVSKGLTAVAKAKNIPYQTEVMGGRSGTNADVISMEAGGCATGLLSIPLRYMHTGIEVVSVEDVENTARLLAAYLLEEGAVC